MYRLILITTLIAEMATAQQKLEGTVYIYNANGRNTLVPHVAVMAYQSGSAVTTGQGYYALLFDNSTRATHLTVRKSGYEVVNVEDIRCVDLSKKKQQNIYLDVEGNTEKRRRNIYDVSITKMKQKLAEYHRILAKNDASSMSLKKKIETETGLKFNSVNDVMEYFEGKFKRDEMALGDIVASVVRVNLDHSNKEVELIKRYTMRGEVDSALLLLNYKKDSLKIVENLKIINAAQTASESNRAMKEKYLSAIPLLLANGYYSEVGSSYQMALATDPDDPETVFSYGIFLQKRDDFKKSIALNRKFLSSLKEKDKYVRSMVFNNLGNVFADMEQFDSSENNYFEAIRIRQTLAEKDDAYYIPLQSAVIDLSRLYRQMSLMPELSQYKEHYMENCIQYLHQAWRTNEYLEKKYPGSNDEELADIFLSLGSAYEAKDAAKSKQYLYNAAGIYKKLNEEGKISSTVCLERLGGIYHNVGLAYKAADRIVAKENFVKALNIREKLCAINKLEHFFYLSMTYIELGSLYEEVGILDSARSNFEKAYQLLSIDKSLTNNQKYIGKVLLSLPILYFVDKQYDDALQYGREAVSVSTYLLEMGYSHINLLNVAYSLKHLGTVEAGVGLFDLAEKHIIDAISYFRKVENRDGRYNAIVKHSEDLLVMVREMKKR